MVIFSNLVVVFVGVELEGSFGDGLVRMRLCWADIGGKWVKRCFFSPGIQMFPNFGTCSTEYRVLKESQEYFD